MVVPAGIISKKQYILKVAYVNERAQSYTRDKNFKVAGNAARLRATEKTGKYAASINPKTQIFQPIICETSGTMNKEGLPKLIEFLAAKFSPVAHFKVKTRHRNSPHTGSADFLFGFKSATPMLSPAQ